MFYVPFCIFGIFLCTSNDLVRIKNNVFPKYLHMLCVWQISLSIELFSWTIHRCSNEELCVPTVDGLRIAPSTRLGLLGHCSTGCDSNTKYEWKIYTADHQWIWKEVLELPTHSDGKLFCKQIIIIWMVKFLILCFLYYIHVSLLTL